MKLFATGLFNPGEWKISRDQAGNIRIEINPVWEFVAMLGLIFGAGVALFLLYCLTIIIMKAIDYGYKVKIGSIKLGEMQIGPFNVDLTLPTFDIELEPA